MNPVTIPQPGPLPTTLFANGYLHALMLITIASLAVIFVMMLWTMWRATRERVRLRCPVRLRRARVLFRLGAAGERIDILRCSIFGHRPVTCGKTCLQPHHG
jgi:hypothetical protein